MFHTFGPFHRSSDQRNLLHLARIQFHSPEPSLPPEGAALQVLCQQKEVTFRSPVSSRTCPTAGRDQESAPNLAGIGWWEYGCYHLVSSGRGARSRSGDRDGSSSALNHQGFQHPPVATGLIFFPALNSNFNQVLKLIHTNDTKITPRLQNEALRGYTHTDAIQRLGGSAPLPPTQEGGLACGDYFHQKSILSA